MAEGGEKTKKLSDHERDLAVLISKIAKECESALKKLYDITIMQVYGLAYRILRNQADADEGSIGCFQADLEQGPQL